MDQDFKDLNEPMMAEAPDDVSTLYSWANLHGSKYRDFSAARREHRAQVRQSMTEQDPLVGNPPQAPYAPPAMSSGQPNVGPGSGMGVPLGEERYAPYSSPTPERVSPAVVYVREYGGPAYAPPIPPIATPASVPYVHPPAPEPAPYYAANPYVQPATETVSQYAPASPVRETTPSARPSWSYTETQTVAPSAGGAAHAGPNAPLHDTLQQSRERVASRWYALKGVFGEQGQTQPEPPQPYAPQHARVPLLAVFSLAGGVGKTSLVATLGRALSHYGERALIVDTGSYGLLPFYFGSREGRPGLVRTFSPPGGTPDAPIHLVSFEMEGGGAETGRPDGLTEEISRAADNMQRVVVDIPTGSIEVARQSLRLATAVLVPILPDMNSVVSLGLIDRFLRQFVGADGRPVQPTFVLSQFDSSLPLHLDVREVLRQQLGDRLLPTTIRRSPAVSEALAEGMTVIDYAPTSPVTEDYLNVASWLRNSSAPASAAFRGTRWSER